VTTAASSITVRPAAPADVPRIAELIKELAEYERSAGQAVATADDLDAALFASQPALFGHVAVLARGDDPPDPPAAVLARGDDPPAAVLGGSVVGFALWFINYSTWVGKHGIYLEDLYVTPEMRGRGAGKALLAELASICVQRGYGRLDWWVLDWNSPAIGFYRSIGAEAMTEWTVYRLSGQSLADLAGK
jgi:GNAT superfamily N-acetyltransferase